MDGARWILSAGTGAAIGVAVVIALDLSFRLARRPAGLAGALPGHAGQLKIAIFALAVSGYVLLGYFYRPTPPEAAAPPAPSGAATALDTGPTQFDVGGVALAFAPPAGMCLYPAPLLQSVQAQQARVNPDNVIHTAFAACGELRDALAEHTRIRDFGILMTPKDDLTQFFDRPALDQLAAATPDPTRVKATLDERLKNAQSQLALQSFSALGTIDRDPRAIYFAFLSKAENAAGGFTQACVMAMTAVNGRLVSYYLYRDYDKDPRPAIFGLLAEAKAGVNDFAQRNGA